MTNEDILLLADVLRRGAYSRVGGLGENYIELSDNPLRSLSVGDSVYYYCVDSSEIHKETVVAVIDGCGFYSWEIDPSRPRWRRLVCVDASRFATTEAEAALLAREDIDKDVDYATSLNIKLSRATELLQDARATPRPTERPTNDESP